MLPERVRIIVIVTDERMADNIMHNFTGGSVPGIIDISMNLIILG